MEITIHLNKDDIRCKRVGKHFQIFAQTPDLLRVNVNLTLEAAHELQDDLANFFAMAPVEDEVENSNDQTQGT